MARLHRRNFLPTAIINLILWITCGLIIFLLDPNNNFKFPILNFNFSIFPNIILFFLTFTQALTLTLALLLGNTRRGFFCSMIIVSLLFLRLNKLAYWWNVVLVIAVFLFTELSLSRKGSRQKRY